MPDILRKIPKKKQIAVFLAVLSMLAVLTYVKIKPYYNFVTQTLDVPVSQAVLGSSDVRATDNTIYFLILGISRDPDHEGYNLSDAISLVSYNKTTNKVLTMGIPRDMWSPTLRDKINTAYAYGEAKMPGEGGLKMAKTEIGSLLGIKIDYGIVVDFGQFTQLVDYVGGVDIYVKESFKDEKYPIAGKENDPCIGEPDYECRYETVEFKQGNTHMDGETALKFVRSRNSIGGQGNDFARGERQQLVIQALKEKILSIVRGKDMDKITNLYRLLDELVERDISNESVLHIGRIIMMHKKFAQETRELPDVLFEVPDYTDYEGKYVLIPLDNQERRVHTYVSCTMEEKQDIICDEVFRQVGKLKEEAKM